MKNVAGNIINPQLNFNAMIKNSLADSLHKLGIKIVSVFSPEHGFRGGNASSGTKVQDEVDSATGIQIVSLYEPRRKPRKEDMDSIDLMIYDVQDVGCRFYTTFFGIC